MCLLSYIEHPQIILLHNNQKLHFKNMEIYAVIKTFKFMLC